MARKQVDDEAAVERAEPDSVLKQIEDALRGLQFGQLTVIVHDGMVIQLDRTERKRLQPGQRVKRETA